MGIDEVITCSQYILSKILWEPITIEVTDLKNLILFYRKYLLNIVNTVDINSIVRQVLRIRTTRENV